MATELIDTPERPSLRVMNEAIELAIEGRSPYPRRASFIDDATPATARQIRNAFADGRAVVLVSADGSTRVLYAQGRRRAGSKRV